MSAATQAAFPDLSTPFIDEGGRVSTPWYLLLIALFKKTGGSQSSQAGTAYVESDGERFDAYTQDGTLLGQLQFVNTEPGAVDALVLTGSPFVYQAPVNGTLVVESGKLEISRGTSDFLQASVVGGALPLKIGDKARISWTLGAPPAHFFRDN